MKYCKKIIFLIIAVLTGMISLTSLSVKAQSSNIWQKVYSRSMQDDATSIKQTSDSGYIVCAVTNAGSALSVIWLLKLDKFGDTLWTKIYNWNANYIPKDIIETKDGGYAITGYTSSKMFLIKTNSFGDTLWRKFYGFGRGFSLTSDNKNCYVIAGEDGSPITKVKIVKTNLSGELIWEKIISDSISTTAIKVKMFNSNIYFVCGRYSIQFYRTYIFKLNTFGDSIKVKYFADSAFAISSFDLTNDNGFILGGNKTKEPVSIVLIKLDSLFNEIFRNIYSSNTNEYCIDILNIPNNKGYSILGFSVSGLGNLKFNVKRFDQFGSVIWENFYHYGEDSEPRQFQLTNDKGFVIAGYGNSNLGFPNVYIVKTDSLGNTSPVGISNYSTEIPNEFILYQNYPNPFNPKTNLKFGIPKSGFVTLKVYDILGKEAKTLVYENQPAGNYIVNFDGSNLSSGVYFYRLETNDFVQTKGMVLLK